MNFKPSEKVLRVFKMRLRTAMWNSGYEYTTHLAKATGINHETLGKWLNGNNLPNAASLERLCTTLNVSADWLLGLED
jgi:transcriptional regulator with XRE-family HTH domain